METHFLQDLAIVMAAAGAMTLLCHQLRQPVVIGYLLAGLLIGPYTPPFSLVNNLVSIHEMAELGLVFLMFSLGLEFNLPKIKKVGASAGVAAVLEVGGMLLVGFLLGKSFGWSRVDSIFLGAILSISSTTIIVKVFMDFKMMRESFAQVVFGILILEDIVAVAILSILSGLGATGGPSAAMVLGSFLRIGLFVVLFLVLGLSSVPRFIHRIARFESKEVLGIVTLGICLGGALLASSLRLSVALGAFLAGAVLAAAQEIERIEEWIHPVRDMFSAIFFVSAGMLIQPQMLWTYKVPILIVTLVTIVGKVLSGTAGAFVAGYDLKTSARVGMSVAQIGEFSFVIASLGLSLNVTSDFLYPLAVTVSSLTTLATPYLIRNSDRIVDAGLRVMPPTMRGSLDRYQHWIEEKMRLTGESAIAAVFPKYLTRLLVYGALVITLLIMTRLLSAVAPGVAGVIWASAGILSLPLLRVFSNYTSHVLLLAVCSNRWVLARIEPHAFFRLSRHVTIVALGGVFLAAASTSRLMPSFLVMIGMVMLVVWVVFRKSIAAAHEWLERRLDHVAGLATKMPPVFDITEQ